MARPSSRQLTDAYLHWLAHERECAPMTVFTYGHTLASWVTMLGNVHVLDAGLPEMRSFVLAPVARATRYSTVGDEPSPATKKRRVAELRGFYKWLSAEGFRHDNPTMRLVAPTVHNENPKPIPHDLWRSFWNHRSLTDEDRVAFGLAYFCGLRRSEVVALGPQHFDGSRLVNFRRKGGGKANLPWRSCVSMVAEREAHLIGYDLDTFVVPLDRLLRDRRNEASVLPWRGNEQIEAYVVNRRLRTALRRCGLDGAAFTPHQARHSFCTNLLEMGVPLLAVSRLANHSSVVITQRYLATAEDPLADLLAAE